jgi:Fe-S-cluster-containing hydrogenase component 2
MERFSSDRDIWEPEMPMVKVLVPVPGKCSGCGLCVMACNVVHGTGLTPARSNLRLEKRCIDLDLVVVCSHGEGCELECMEACPAEAIGVGTTGAVLISYAKCIACGMCGRACPFSVIWEDEGDKAFKCDLCEGDPACVRYCQLDAIEYRDAEPKDFDLIREHVEEVCE